MFVGLIDGIMQKDKVGLAGIDWDDRGMNGRIKFGMVMIMDRRKCH